MSARESLLALVRLRAYERRRVVLKRGRVSEFYVDCRNVALHPQGVRWCGETLTALLADGPAFDAVAGPSIGADPLVAAVAYCSGLQGGGWPALMVRPEAKEHGTGRRVEGLRNVPAGGRVAVVEDVLTTGGSALRTVEALREVGLVPVRVVALVDREEGGADAVRAAGLHVATVFTRTDIAPELPPDAPAA